MSPEVLRHIELPPDAPRPLRIGLYLRKFLAHHTRLDGYLAFAAVYWGALTLIFPGFWSGWAVTDELGRWTGGHPEIVSWSLLLSGVGSYLSRRYRWHAVRSICALVAFGNWGTLALVFALVHPIYTPGLACYSLLAIGKAMSYVSFAISLDEERRAARLVSGERR